MTDITRKLELMANTHPGVELIHAPTVAKICADALAEIKFLKSELVRHSQRKADLPDNRGRVCGIPYATIPVFPENLPLEGSPYVSAPWPDDPRLVEKPDGTVVINFEEPAPEPWGSPFAMNTENWA